MQPISRHAITIGLSYLSALVSFLTTLLLARLLGAEDFGIVALALAVGAFSAPLINLGADRIFVRDYLAAQTGGSRHWLARNNFMIRLGMAGVVALALVAISFVVVSGTEEALSHSTLLVWAALMGLYPMPWFDAVGRTSLQNALNLGEKVLALLAVAMLYSGPESWRSALLVGLIVGFFRIGGIAFQYWTWWRWCRPSAVLSAEKPNWRESGISLRVTGVVLASSCVAYANQIALEVHGNRFELGAFGIAFQTVNMVILFQSQALRLLMQDIAGVCVRPNSIKSSLVKHATSMLFVSAALAGMAWGVMELLPMLLPDPRYALIHNFSMLLCGWSAVVGAGQVVSQYALNLGLERVYLRITFVGALVAIGLGHIFVPQGGAESVAILLLAVHSAMMLATAYVVFWTIRNRVAEEGIKRDQ